MEKAVAVDTVRSNPTNTSGHGSLSLINRAVQIDTQVHAKLDQFVKMKNSDDAAQKEIRDLTNELGTIVDEAGAVHAADDFASQSQIVDPENSPTKGRGGVELIA